MRTEINERMNDNTREEPTIVYSPTMTDAEIEALIAHLHHNTEARTHERPNTTDAVKLVRKMRAARSEELNQRSRNADRR